MSLTNQKPSLYPGMLCNGVEFFAVESEMKFIANGEVKPILNLPYQIVELGHEHIDKEPDLLKALQEWHPNSKTSQFNQFLKCRYGGLDYSADLEDNQFKDGDYFHCSKRSTCKYNGVICLSPKYKGKKLTAIEIKLMQLLSTNLTNEVIAEKLTIPYGSFHKYKQVLYEKLEVQTKPEIALITKSLNLI
ncbi:helix-turn-helix transcriptional regulator [Tenacibaculum soleae]|uniref:helix-turn-helix transcriptional regulator n=1 Tax=Tenacibaculum soleae TaxID=447689 RepID=UPI00230002AB|nr:LuxR C-terminal-related transcriptional regulator [Tenacibaculum soleae]